MVSAHFFAYVGSWYVLGIFGGSYYNVSCFVRGARERGVCFVCISFGFAHVVLCSHWWMRWRSFSSVFGSCWSFSFFCFHTRQLGPVLLTTPFDDCRLPLRPSRPSRVGESNTRGHSVGLIMSVEAATRSTSFLNIYGNFVRVHLIANATLPGEWFFGYSTRTGVAAAGLGRWERSRVWGTRLGARASVNTGTSCGDRHREDCWVVVFVCCLLSHVIFSGVDSCAGVSAVSLVPP